MTSSSHPQELFADYVDGTLATDERAVVDAHLSTCAACRQEIELARRAVAALASLEELPVPLGVTGPVLAEAGRTFEHRRVAVWQRVQWAAGAAAAAAIVLVVALNVTGNGGNESPTAGGTMAAGAPTQDRTAMLEAVDVLEKHDASYGDADVRSFAQVTAVSVEDDGGPLAGAESGPAIEFVPAAAGLRCLETAGVPLYDPRDTLVRLIEARYGRTPAYFAVFLESPGADQPADTAVVWVVARGDCRILTFASQGF
jgi:anti-sigma-K factor RskA